MLEQWLCLTPDVLAHQQLAEMVTALHLHTVKADNGLNWIEFVRSYSRIEI